MESSSIQDFISAPIDIYRLRGTGSGDGDDDDDRADQLIAPPLLWLVFAAIAGPSVICGAICAAGILRKWQRGFSALLLHLIFVDLLSLPVLAIELFYISEREWTFPALVCHGYLGLDAFAGISTSYLIILLGLQAISLAGEAEEAVKNVKLENCTSTESIDEDGYDVAEHIHKRSLTIDYSKAGYRRVKVVFPQTLITLLALSIAAPFFIFAKIEHGIDEKVCQVSNLHEKNGFVLLLLLFRVFIPTLFIILLIILGAKRLRRLRKRSEIFSEIRIMLKIAIWLSITYALLSFQRLFGSLIFEKVTREKLPLVLGLSLLVIHFSLATIRPMLVIILRSQFPRSCGRTKSCSSYD